MTTDLRDQLERLAHDAPPAAAPSDLWDRGVRRQRRTRVVAALAAGALVVAGALVGSLAWDVRRPDPTPVDTSADAALPDRLSTPSPRTSSTAEDGPLGALAAIAGAERATSWWGGTGNGLVGVSATTGEYRFLDLPGRIDSSLGLETDPTLSPDGRLVGYWLHRPGPGTLIDGFAVYDTTTGAVTRHVEDRSTATLGVYAVSMSWVDEDTLAVTYGTVTEQSADSLSGRGIATRLWTPSEGDPVPVQDDPNSGSSTYSPTAGGFAGLFGTRLREWDGTDGALRSTTRFAATPATRDAVLSVVSPDGRRVAGLDVSSTASSKELVTGSVDDPRLARVPTDVRMFELLGWVDPGHVVARGRLGGDPPTAGIYSIDVDTGEDTALVTEDRLSWGQFPDYADDLFARPSVSRPAPPRITDPRLVAAGGAGIALLLGASGAVVWSRRAHA